jgi:hypothetical protein
MAQMAKSANSKVIFLPAQNQTVQSQMAIAEQMNEGPSRYHDYGTVSAPRDNDFSGKTDGMQDVVNARVVENM